MQKPDIYKVCGMIVKNRRTLVARSIKDPTTFMTVSGKPEGDETELETLIRELDEEVGITLSATNNPVKIGTYTQEAFNKPGKIAQIDAYVITDYEGEPKPQAEIVDIRWVNSSEATTMDLASVVKTRIIPDMAKQGLID